MGLIKNRKNKIKEVQFLKEAIDLNETIALLEDEMEKVDEEGEKLIYQDINKLYKDIELKEKFKAYLLKSEYPFLVIEDLHMAYKGSKISVDYVLLTAKKIFFITYLSLSKYEDMDIDKVLKNGERFLNVFEEMSGKVNSNSFTAIFIHDKFADKFNSIVVCDDELETIDDSRIVKASKLFTYLEEANEDYKYKATSYKKILAQAQYFIDNHEYSPSYNLNKYAKYLLSNKTSNDYSFSQNELDKLDELKELRSKIAYQEHMPLKFIFDDNLIESWLINKVISIDELNDLDLEIKEKYAQEIISILIKN